MKKVLVLVGLSIVSLQSEARVVIKGIRTAHPRPHYYKCIAGKCETCYDSGAGTTTQLQELPGGLWKVVFTDIPSDTISGGTLECQ